MAVSTAVDLNNTSSIPDGSLILTGYAPVTEDGYSLVNIPDGALSLTGYAPTIDNGAGNTVTLSTGSLILTGYAPTFETVLPQECAFIAQSSIPLGFIGTEGAFTAESDLLSYQTQESAFTAQSILNVYAEFDGAFTAESILNAYVPQQSDFIAQSANTIIPLSPITVVFTRLLLISSAIEFFFGFFLPEPVKKVFLKQEEL